MLRDWSLRTKTRVAFLMLCAMVIIVFINQKKIIDFFKLFSPAQLLIEEGQAILEEIEIKPTEQIFAIDREIGILTSVDNPPKFPGGRSALFRFLHSNIQYPSVAKQRELQGTIYIGFAVMENGSIRKIKNQQGTPSFLVEEAIRVVKSMPDWIPGKQRGKPVRVAFTLPIRFKLE